MKSRIIRLAMTALAAAGVAWAARRSAEAPARGGAQGQARDQSHDQASDRSHDQARTDAPASARTEHRPVASPEPQRGPEVSSLDEVHDGGHGLGSAAPIAGGIMPLGHSVKAWEDTRTFAEPGQDAYAAEPHVWFRDADTAAAAGFSPAP